MNKILIFAFIITISLSCTKYTQIYETKPNSIAIKDEKFYNFENDTVKITYSFWQEKGVLSYTFFNKLNIPLYIDWKKCSFIRNGEKLDFWIDETTTNSVSNSRGTSNLFFGDYNLLAANVGRTSTKGKSVKPERVIFLAPRSSITRVQFQLYPFAVSKINGNKSQMKIAGSKKTIESKYEDFNLGNSPLVFRNFMSISSSEKFEREMYIDNGFYVSKISQIKRKYFIGQTVHKSKAEEEAYNSQFINPKMFFITVK